MSLAASDKFEMLSAIRHNNLLALKAIVLLAPLQHRYTARNIDRFPYFNYCDSEDSPSENHATL